jgi:DivIVA domain-containing protein
MGLTPDQIETAVFTTVRRDGYSKDQVDRFLRLVASEFRSLQRDGAAPAPAPAPLAPRAPAEAGGAAEDLQAASAEMAALLAEFHTTMGERRRHAEFELADMRAAAEREAAAIISAAAEQGEAVRQQADRQLADAEHQAELLRSDGEQRVRERCADTLRVARAELQDLLRRKHEILATLASARERIGEAEESLERAVIAPDVLDDAVVTDTLIDIRERLQSTGAASAAASAAVPPPPPPPPGHPAGSGSIFSLPDEF